MADKQLAIALVGTDEASGVVGQSARKMAADLEALQKRTFDVGHDARARETREMSNHYDTLAAQYKAQHDRLTAYQQVAQQKLGTLRVQRAGLRATPEIVAQEREVHQVGALIARNEDVQAEAERAKQAEQDEMNRRYQVAAGEKRAADLAAIERRIFDSTHSARERELRDVQEWKARELADHYGVMERFDLASLYPVKVADMKLSDAALWVEEFSECFRALEALSDADLSDFLSRLSFNDTIMNELRLLVVDAKLTHKCGAGIFSLQVTPELEFYPCMFTQYPDLRMGNLETGIDPAWFQGFESRRRAGAEPECAGCEIVSVCGGCCLDWARKDSHGNGWFSPTECAYRRGLVKAAKEFLERVKGRPLVMHAIRDRLDLCNREWRPKRKGE